MFRIPIKRVVARRTIKTVTVAAVAAVSAVAFIPRDSYVLSAASTPTPVPAELVTIEVPKVLTISSVGGNVASTQATMGLPNLEHERVQSWIKRFTTTQRSSFATYLRRMPRYESMITKKLDARGMPRGLVYLAMIESGFNPTARSQVAATGLWQFMTPTAREYGLKVGRGVDERRNPARSTDAALRYLNNLYNRFGSWYLAAAAYNTGQGRVARVLKQVTGKTKGTDADYYRIAHRLPKETRDYVPKMIAAARIGTNPERYGFSGD